MLVSIVIKNFNFNFDRAFIDIVNLNVEKTQQTVSITSFSLNNFFTSLNFYYD